MRGGKASDPAPRTTSAVLNPCNVVLKADGTGEVVCDVDDPGTAVGMSSSDFDSRTESGLGTAKDVLDSKAEVDRRDELFSEKTELCELVFLCRSLDLSFAMRYGAMADEDGESC